MSVFGRVSTIIVNWDIQRLKLGSTNRVLKNGPSKNLLGIKETVCYFLVMGSFSILIGTSTSHRSQKPRPLHPKALPMVPQAGQHQRLQVPAVEQPAMV